MRINKYNYLWVIQGNYGYGHGWEDLCASESILEANENFRSYLREEGIGNYRRIERRELNTNYINGK